MGFRVLRAPLIYATKPLLEPLSYIPPAEAEANYYEQLSGQAIPA